VAALRGPAMQPANQLANLQEFSVLARKSSDFPESCPGFEKRLKAVHLPAVVAIVRSARPP
jgi:hypothetical protein